MCMADGCDEFSTVLREESRRARKPHRCCECGRHIAPGETYHFEVTLDDGHVSTYKVCTHCMVVREWLLKECSGFIYTCTREDLHEHVMEGGWHYPVSVKLLDIGQHRSWTRKDGRLWRVPKCPPSTHEIQAAMIGPPRPPLYPGDNAHER